MQKKMPRNQRKNYFIKKGFQVSFILKFCLLIILACILMGGVVYFLSTKTVTTSFENLRLVSKSTADYIFPNLLLSSLVAIILVSLACIIAVLFISHRIAGPLYRFERSIQEITGGDLTINTNLRKTDEIKILADTLNTMVKKIRESVIMSQDKLLGLENELAVIRQRLHKLGVSKEEIDEILKASETKIKNLKDNLSYFKVGK